MESASPARQSLQAAANEPIAGFSHAMDCQNVLGEIDSNGYDSHDFPSPSWDSVALDRNPHGVRLTWDGEVPSIR